MSHHAIILAAGRGSRMGQLTQDNPKCLTQVDGKALLDYQVESLTNAGISNIGIVTGYQSHLLDKYRKKTFYNDEWNETNMVYSLLKAKEWLDQFDCIISYSDIIYSADIIKKLITCNSNIAISYDPNWFDLWSKRFKNPLEDAETFKIDKNNFLLDIGRKTSNLNEINGQYMGLLKFKKGIWKNIINDYSEINYKKTDMTSLLQLIKNDFPIECIKNNDFWAEIDSISDIEALKFIR